MNVLPMPAAPISGWPESLRRASQVLIVLALAGTLHLMRWVAMLVV